MTAFRRFMDAVLARWPWWALFASALMLAIAHAFETFGGLSPCILCLKQREVYWVAGTMAVIGIAAGFTPLRAWAPRVVCGLLAVAFLVGMGIAIYHAGAEWKFWPGPAACAANRHGVTAADMAAVLSGAKSHAPSCEEAAWRLFGISMAGYNVLISLKLAILSGLAAKGSPQERGIS
jgi:disulfide bond formation protein DsbB